jgi:Phosphotransacetylase
MVYSDFEQLENSFHSFKKRTVAVAAAHDKAALTAVGDLRAKGLMDAILIGDETKIRELISDMEGDFRDIRIRNELVPEEAARKACVCVRDGEADLILKGKLDTSVLLKQVVSEENGLRTGRLMSHLAFLKIPNYHKILVLTDSGMVLYPDLDQKKEIILNAVESLHNMGYENPRVGVLAAVEHVTPKQPETEDAAALTEMNRRGEIPGCIVEGPLSYDILMSSRSAHMKGFDSPIVGNVDIMVVPDMPAGNILGKALVFSAEADMAGMIVGAKAPIALTSRGATDKEKRQSLLLAAACVKGDK